MKRTLLITAMAILFVAFTMDSFAQGGRWGKGQNDRSAQKHNFVDADGDGICDNFVDADGDGKCDNCDGPKMKGQGKRGQGMNGEGKGLNKCENFIDADGDGICDNFVDADGDGKCDNCEGPKMRGQGKRGQGMRGEGRNCKGNGERLRDSSCQIGTFIIAHPYPNPFVTVTNIKITVPETGNVIVDIFDLIGNKITTIFNGELVAGEYEYQWAPGNIKAGRYLIQVTYNNYIKSKHVYYNPES